MWAIEGSLACGPMGTNEASPAAQSAADDESPTPIVLDPDSVLDHLVSAGLWVAGGAWLAGATSAIRLVRRFVDRDRAEPLDRLYVGGQLLLTGCRWKAVVHPEVREDGQYFFFQNHVNHFDHCAMYRATKHVKQGVELEEHFAYPFYGPYMRSRGTIPVARGSASGLKRLIKGVRTEVELGHSILIFPEGTRTTTGRVMAMQPGVFRIAMDVGLPIVPVAVTGMYETMRKGSLVIHPGHEVTVFYEKPIPTKGLPRTALPELMQEVHATLSARVDAHWRSVGRL